MEKNFGIRFTEEQYATKDDVKKALNISSIDSIWDKVCQYRAYYTRQIDLKNIERVPFSIVLPSKLSSKIINLEKKLSKVLIKYSMSKIKDEEYSLRFREQCYIEILKVVSKNYDVALDIDTLNAIINNSMFNLPIEYVFIDRYYQCLKNIEMRHNGSLHESSIVSLYCKLRGLDFNVDDLTQYYRKSDLIDKSDHVFIGKHYDAAPLDRIEDMLKSLCDFLNNSTLFSFVKASIAYFYINYIKPFEYYNEEMALLLFKYILAKEDFDDLASLISLEEILSKENEKNLNFLSRESELKLDMTYITNYLVDVSLTKINELMASFEDFDYSKVYEETYQNSTISLQKNDFKDVHEVSNERVFEHSEEIDGVKFMKNVSIPTLPTGLDEKDANLVASNLLEIYPSMKSGQAQFYSRHCTIGKYYTISQYKKEQDVAYETARTSMDNLANLGLYKKEQIKNKFVYTPVVK